MAADLVSTPVAVAGAPPVWFLVDPTAGDPVAGWFLEHDWIDEPVQRMFVDLVAPGARVVDLGCHLGTFALAAAACGAEVIAVDASARHVELLAAAAEQNGFASLQTVHGAISDEPHPVDFIEQSIHGRLWRPGDPVDGTVVVPSVTVDELLDRAGWESVGVVKMDVEGAEAAALRGMARLFRGGARPSLVFECNGAMLPLQGSSTEELQRELAHLGYRLFLIDHVRVGVLVETRPGSVQPESASDYLAVVDPAVIPEGWEIEAGLSLERTVTRVLHQGASPAAGYRSYAARLLARGPAWLRLHSLAAPAMRALASDVDAGVRAATEAPGPPMSPQATAPPKELPAEILVHAEGLALYEQPPELEHLPERDGDRERVVVDLSLHVRRGEVVGLVVDRPEVGTALLRALARVDQPAAGSLYVGGHVALLAGIGQLLEPRLTVAENVAMLAAYLGGHVPDVAGRLADLCRLAGIDAPLASELGESTVETAVRLVVATALEAVSVDLLLVDDLPLVDDGDFRRRVDGRLRERVGAGLSVMLLAREPGAWLVRPDRVAWIEDGRLEMCGHSESVGNAVLRRRLGIETRDARARTPS